VTGYQVEYRLPEQSWITANDTPINGLELVVPNLTPSTKYQFRVAAVDMFDNRSYSEEMEMITAKVPSVPAQPGKPDPPRKPGQPGKPAIVKVDGTSVTLNWTAPWDNGAKITSYIIRYGVPGHSSHKYSRARFDGQISMRTLTQLKPKTKYHFAVYAENKLGRGHLSEYSETITTDNNLGK